MSPHSLQFLLFPLTDLQLSDFSWKNEANKYDHHTDKYYSNELITRRGQPFKLSVSFNRPMSSGDKVTFIASTGPNPSESARTRAVIPLTTRPSGNPWNAIFLSNDGSSISLTITSPPNAPIGRYTLTLQIASQGGYTTTNLGTWVQLFNPWLEVDAVFMMNNAEREEYVEEDAGIIYVGSTNRINMVGWNFGQFEEDILNISLQILDRSLNFRRDPVTDVARRNDPKYIGRVLSGMINGNDDNGVLSGNWSGDYTGGKDPRNWNGSVEILKEWKKNRFQPVRFGQCWVFAGTLNTVLRCLGIPARVITNFNSAHDTDRNLTIDVYYDSLGNPLDKGSDSIWNFHVWNEAWFVRTDLNQAYNGWQVLDATPQERSQGVFQCGPASVIAVREGDVNLDFDMPFVFSEVNADQVTWIMGPGDNKRQTSSKTSSVGRFISTKAVGSNSRMDVTDRYKYAEGSKEEREVFKKALEKMKPSSGAFGPTAAGAGSGGGKPPSISGKFRVIGGLEVGKEVNLGLQLKNLTEDWKTVTVNMTAWTIVYNGTLVHEVWKDSITVSLDPQEEMEYPLRLTYAQYKNFLTADNMIRITAVCKVTDEAQVVVERDVILDNPAITLELLDQARVKTPVNVRVLFANPLDEPVDNCVLTVEGSGLMRGNLKIRVPSLRPKERSNFKFEITPLRSGTKQLLIDFSCSKFPAIKAFLSVDVTE
ncbi:protein-glutamine gamma-glutamyltransferase E [Dromiciops gliroides]|uniref:protein-glutamine gamma-glutamyltransferase E n=1 Tax=Dromiciops gliroides TaxID=33562 RepID=UPI001CC7CCC8|nr:protein-glutamine gamma-glutamyltransferase E [Dromiciops gliroides]